MKQAQNTTLRTYRQRQTNLSEVNVKNIIRNVRVKTITASIS